MSPRAKPAGTASVSAGTWPTSTTSPTGSPCPAGRRHHQYHPAERFLHQWLQPRPLCGHCQGSQSRPGLRWLDQDRCTSPSSRLRTTGAPMARTTALDIFEMSTNADGEPMLKHAPLGDASPVEVREAESVNGPLAVLNDYYDVYVTLPRRRPVPSGLDRADLHP